jgi:tRNA (guanine-N7-)-methyltransferase
MRPKNLKFPFTWDNRKPIVHEGVLIVPHYYTSHGEWKDELGLFSKEVCIEFCSGNGDWVLEKAAQNPSQYWVAVEMQFERVQKIWSKMHNQKVSNLLIVSGKAQEFARYYLPDGCAREIYVNFPDPWPKERHAKHRLIQKEFVDELARIVRGGGKATYATDDPTYSAQMIAEMRASPKWSPDFNDPFYIKEWESYGDSWFKNLWAGKGRDFFYMQFTRQLC